MSTDPSTDPADVSGDVAAGGHGTNRSPATPPAAVSAGAGQGGRRSRRGRRRRSAGGGARNGDRDATGDHPGGQSAAPPSSHGGSAGATPTAGTADGAASPPESRPPSPADLARRCALNNAATAGDGTAAYSATDLVADSLGGDGQPDDRRAPGGTPGPDAPRRDDLHRDDLHQDDPDRDDAGDVDSDDPDDDPDLDGPVEPSVAGARTRVTGPKPSDMAVLTAKITKTGLSHGTRGAKNPRGRRRGNRADRTADGLRTVRETSAGGLVISDLDLPMDELSAALIGRVDRRGRTMWSLPKGHIETGETAEQTAVREVAEETGIQGTVVAPLGKIDYWFVSEGRRIHKTVHHYLLRSVGGELSDADYEVSEVAWVPLRELPRKLTYSDERRLARMARGVIADLAADPQRLARSEAESSRTEPNAYERAAAARNQRRNEPARRKEAKHRTDNPAPARSRRRRRRPRRSSGDA